MLKIFLPHLSKESPSLLIYDGHLTRIQMNILENAVKLGVTIIKFHQRKYRDDAQKTKRILLKPLEIIIPGTRAGPAGIQVIEDKIIGNNASF